MPRYKSRLRCWLFGHRWVRVSMHRGVPGRWQFCANCRRWRHDTVKTWLARILQKVRA